MSCSRPARSPRNCSLTTSGWLPASPASDVNQSIVSYSLGCGASCDSSDILAWKHRCMWCATKAIWCHNCSNRLWRGNLDLLLRFGQKQDHAGTHVAFAAVWLFGCLQDAGRVLPADAVKCAGGLPGNFNKLLVNTDCKKLLCPPPAFTAFYMY